MVRTVTSDQLLFQVNSINELVRCWDDHRGIGRPRMDIDDHRLTAVTQRRSPHADERPPGTPVSLIVVHGISLPAGHFGGPYIDDLFTGDFQSLLAAHTDFGELDGVRVSSHLLIERNGELTQYVPFDRRAWHAGESCFRGNTGCNDFSIGIELEGTDNEPYRREQYERLSTVVRLLAAAYPIEAVLGHSDIAPGRKSDPGPAFDWRLVHHLLKDRTGYTLSLR